MVRLPAAIGLAAGSFVALSSVLAQPIPFTINTTERHQTIEGWGAMVSPLSPGVEQTYANPAFAARLRDDLGLTMVRIEVPPYVYENEDLDPLNIDWTRFNFSWMNAAGNLVALMNQDHPHAVKVLLAFWSPPAWMKTNDDVNNGGNLREDRYMNFGKFCAATCMAFPFNYGEPIYALSIQNEPVFIEPYLSCVYSPEQYTATVHAVAESLEYFGVDTLLFGSEDVGTIPSRWMSYVTDLQTDPVAWNRMRGLAIHHYPWGPTTGDDSNPQAWSDVRDQIAPTGKPLWQTERSGEDPSWTGIPSNSKGGLYLAREIHDAMKFGDVSLYLYWSITEDQPDVYGLMALSQPTSKYYAAKHFFHYIKPGSVRIGTSEDAPEVLTSAYVNDAEQTMTVVIVNKGEAAATVQLSIDGPVSVSSFSVVRTSESEQADDVDAIPVTAGQATVSMPRWSVVTLVGSTSCYANCDGSATPPILNVLDFTCYLSRFAAGESYANCDGSTSDPALNILDFTCFLQKFAAGCQ